MFSFWLADAAIRGRGCLCNLALEVLPCMCEALASLLRSQRKSKDRGKWQKEVDHFLPFCLFLTYISLVKIITNIGSREEFYIM